MNTPRLCLKKFFSFLIFFDTDRKIQAVESRYLARDQLLRHKLHQAEDKIRDLNDSVSWLEQQRSENMVTIKKRAMEMAHLEDQLEKTLKEKQECREKISALQITHRKLVEFLEKTNALPKSS